jgi:hypothetical protein
VPAKKKARLGLSKRTRFEVLKRDSFKCQYCGATAPQVLLHVDHIVSVADGGADELTNLATSCQPCNSGKGARALSDDSAVTKARNQLEELQLRREQLEMMMEWKQALRDLTSDTALRVCEYWEESAPGFSVNENGRKLVAQWVKKFSIDEVTSAMDVAASQYLKQGTDGKVSADSWELGFSKIPGICRVERASKDDPDLKDLFYIRGILRNKCRNYFRDPTAMEWLRSARSWGVSMERLREIAYGTKNWSHFVDVISEAIDERKREEGA